MKKKYYARRRRVRRRVKTRFFVIIGLLVLEFIMLISKVVNLARNKRFKGRKAKNRRLT